MLTPWQQRGVMEYFKANRLLFPILAGALVLCWSSGFVGIRFATVQAPVFMVLFWRSFVSGLVLLPFALILGPRLTLRAIGEQALLGTLGMFVYLAGFALAIGERVPTGLVALIADMMPLAIAALSLPVLGQRLTAEQWTGTGIGLAGVLLVSADSLQIGSAPAFAYLLPFAGMISFAYATLLQKRRARAPVALHQSLCLQCLVAAVLFAGCAWFGGGLVPPATLSFAFGVGWLVSLATFGGYGIYYLCLRFYSPAQVSSVLLLSPPVTMLWAWAMFGEPLSHLMVLGLAITLFGVWLASET
jgi:drug/metabolite transporter (DMT)-like permease